MHAGRLRKNEEKTRQKREKKRKPHFSLFSLVRNEALSEKTCAGGHMCLLTKIRLSALQKKSSPGQVKRGSAHGVFCEALP